MNDHQESFDSICSHCDTVCGACVLADADENRSIVSSLHEKLTSLNDALIARNARLLENQGLAAEFFDGVEKLKSEIEALSEALEQQENIPASSPELQEHIQKIKV